MATRETHKHKKTGISVIQDLVTRNLEKTNFTQSPWPLQNAVENVAEKQSAVQWSGRRISPNHNQQSKKHSGSSCLFISVTLLSLCSSFMLLRNKKYWKIILVYSNSGLIFIVFAITLIGFDDNIVFSKEIAEIWTDSDIDETLQLNYTLCITEETTEWSTRHASRQPC